MIKILSHEGFTNLELGYLLEAADKCNEISKTDVFKSAVMTAVFSSTSDNNQKIYDTITQSYEVHAFIRSYSRWNWFMRNVVASEGPNGVTFNRKFFDSGKLADHCNTLFHEMCHQAGYHHVSAKDYSSVPYQCGNIIGNLIKQGL